MENLEEADKLNLNELVQGTIIGIDCSREVQSEFKALIQTIKCKVHSQYPIIEHLLIYLDGVAKLEPAKRVRSQEAAEACLEILSKCVDSAYFGKAANLLEFL